VAAIDSSRNGASPIDSADVSGRCADLVHRFATAYGWNRTTTLHDVPWPELILLREKIEEHENAKREWEAGLQGIELDGGAGGSGLSGTTQPAIGHDPTQGRGTPAWQQAVAMGLAKNARQRRN
jgi:hypothetical protein